MNVCLHLDKHPVLIKMKIPQRERDFYPKKKKQKIPVIFRLIFLPGFSAKNPLVLVMGGREIRENLPTNLVEISC